MHYRSTCNAEVYPFNTSQFIDSINESTQVWTCPGYQFDSLGR